MFSNLRQYIGTKIFIFWVKATYAGAVNHNIPHLSRKRKCGWIYCQTLVSSKRHSVSVWPHTLSVSGLLMARMRLLLALLLVACLLAVLVDSRRKPPKKPSRPAKKPSKPAKKPAKPPKPGEDTCTSTQISKLTPTKQLLKGQPLKIVQSVANVNSYIMPFPSSIPEFQIIWFTLVHFVHGENVFYLLNICISTMYILNYLSF